VPDVAGRGGGLRLSPLQPHPLARALPL
jgi:hypothetical protein